MFIEIGDSLINLAEIEYIKRCSPPYTSDTIIGFKSGSTASLHVSFEDVVAKIKKALISPEPDILKDLP